MGRKTCAAETGKCKRAGLLHHRAAASKELSRVTKALTDAGFEIEEREEGVFVKDPVSGADIAFTL